MVLVKFSSIFKYFTSINEFFSLIAGQISQSENLVPN